MPNDPRDGRSDSAPLFLSWGLPTSVDTPEAFFDGPALWLTGGAALLLWTALSLLLTSA